jgi:plasmid segregation protein ParM
MIIDGKKVLVGEGEFETEVNKLDKDMFKACVLKAMALSTEDDILKAIVGLPSNQFNSKNKDRLKHELLADKIYSFELAGKERTIIVEDLDFFPECAGAYHSMTKEQRTQIEGRDLVLVNLGGGNSNIGYFKIDGRGRKMVKSSTIMSGVLHLYADVVNAINGEFSLNKTIEDGERILTRNELMVYGEKQNLSFLKDIIEMHLDKIFKELNLYPIRDSAVMFTGGAIKLYKKILMKRVPNCLFQTNFLLGNAQGFKKAGEYKWQSDCL